MKTWKRWKRTVFLIQIFFEFWSFWRLWSFVFRATEFFCMNLILMLCVFNYYVKCSLLGFLLVFNYCVATTEDVPMGEIVKFVSGSSSIANLGLFRKLKAQFKYWWLNSNRICKCKPAISTHAVFDIASALQ